MWRSQLITRSRQPNLIKCLSKLLLNKALDVLTNRPFICTYHNRRSNGITQHANGSTQPRSVSNSNESVPQMGCEGEVVNAKQECPPSPPVCCEPCCVECCPRKKLPCPPHICPIPPCPPRPPPCCVHPPDCPEEPRPPPPHCINPKPKCSKCCCRNFLEF